MPGKPVTQLDFSGGANLVVNPYLISQNQSREIDNMVLDEHGSVRTRDGQVLLTTGPDPGRVKLRGILVKNSGTEFPFAVLSDISGGNPVTFDTSGSASFSAGTATVSATLGASATLLTVAIHINHLQSVVSITYDGVAMTKLGALIASGLCVELWGLVGPTTGSAANIHAIFNGGAAGRLHWSSWNEAVGWSGVTITSGSGTSISQTVASSANSIVIDIGTTATSSATVTPGAGQTEMYDTTLPGSDSCFGSRETGASSVTMSQTISASVAWVHIAASLDSTGGDLLYQTDTSPWTSIGTLNTEDLPDVAYMSDQAIFAHGYSVPKRWDGTTFTNVTGGSGVAPAGAKHLCFHLGALWIWNTAEATGVADGPSSLEASAINDPNDWPASNQIFISKDDGQVGMGLVPFTIVETGIAPTATLVLFKNYRCYQVTGVFGASTFGIQPIKSDMGCVAPRTIQFVSGFGVIRLTHKGFALYNGVEDRLISEEVRPLVFGSREEAGLDFTNIQLSHAVQSQNPPLYIAACPVSGTGLTRLFVYDLIRRGWTVITLPQAISCTSLVHGRSQFPTVEVGTAETGEIFRLFTGALDDDGDAIDWSMRTRSFFVNNTMVPAYWRRAQIMIAGPPNTPINVTAILDTTERTTQTLYLADSTAEEIEDVISLDILETAHTCQLLIEGTGPCRIRGIELHVVAKPSTKYVSRR